MAEAEKSEPNDPNAMALATVDGAGLPNVRMVLLKAYGPDGFVFYTNSESAKGTELAANLKAALLLYWKSLHRQVRIRGPVEMVSEDEADAYFATRSRESRVGAWASQQSRPLPSRAALEEAVQRYTAELAGRDVARPSYWKSYRVVPLEIEFWHSRPAPAARPDRVPATARRRAFRQDAALSVAAARAYFAGHGADPQ